MAFILLLYALLVLLGAALAWAVYRRLRRFGRLTGGVAALGCLVVVALCWPIPIHGGLTTVLEVLLAEFGRQRTVWRQQAGDERRAAFLRRYEQRFAGELSCQPLGEATGNWRPVTTAGGRPAWLDRGHHLIWSEAVPWPANADFSLEEPRAFCRQLSPAGYWSLPSSAELALFWQAGGAGATGGPAVNAASFSVDETLLLEVPSLHLGRGGQSVLRCVARAAGAPPRGYLDRDIARELWNSYQLARTTGELDP